MSRGFIRVQSKGNIGKIELHALPSGDPVVNFSLACTEIFNDRNGARKEETQWLRCVAYRKTAELIFSLVEAGTELLLDGKLKNRKWQDQNGHNRETTEIVVDSFDVLRRGKQRDEQNQQQGYQQNAQSQHGHRNNNHQPQYNGHDNQGSSQGYNNQALQNSYRPPQSHQRNPQERNNHYHGRPVGH